jgi:hypothetical protein
MPLQSLLTGKPTVDVVGALCQAGFLPEQVGPIVDAASTDLKRFKRKRALKRLLWAAVPVTVIALLALAAIHTGNNWIEREYPLASAEDIERVLLSQEYNVTQAKYCIGLEVWSEELADSAGGRKARQGAGWLQLGIRVLHLPVCE